MNAAKDCTLQEKLLRCAMALILAAGALLASVAASPAYAAPSTVDVSIGGKIPYGGFATTWMSADGNIAYCAEPSSPTPAPGSYSTSPVPSGDVTAAIWFSFGSPGFDASMFPSSWYDGGGWDDAKYAAASHVLIAYAYSGSESAATHGTSAEFASWAKSELIGGTFAKMKAFNEFLAGGAVYIATHPDDVCPTDGVPMPDVGSFIALFARASGRTPQVVCGKPYPVMGECVARAFGCPPSRTCMVGDRLHTDIRFGNANGMRTLLVLSGETTRENMKNFPDTPDVILESVAEL